MCDVSGSMATPTRTATSVSAPVKALSAAATPAWRTATSPVVATEAMNAKNGNGA